MEKPATVLTLTNKYTKVSHCVSEFSYLITVPKYYFNENIEFWGFSKLGFYYNDLLIDSPQDKLSMYIFNTEDGDSQENISKIMNFIEYNQEDPDDRIYSFTQCAKCNQIGSIRQKFIDFNFIKNEICEHCTNLVKDVSSSVSTSEMTNTKMA